MSDEVETDEWGGCPSRLDWPGHIEPLPCDGDPGHSPESSHSFRWRDEGGGWHAMSWTDEMAELQRENRRLMEHHPGRRGKRA